MDTVSEFQATEQQAIASEGLAQDPFVESRAVFKPTTLRTKGDESTNEPPATTPHNVLDIRLQQSDDY